MTFQLRAYSDDDRDFVVSSWLFSYARSAYGIARGAHIPSAMPGYTKRPEKTAWDAFWSDEEPIVRGLVESCDVAIACDPGAPHVIWGWVCTTGDVVHYVLVKRSVHAESAKETRPGVWEVTTGVSGDIYRALLGDRMTRACGYTHELVDFRRRELRAQSVTLPRAWYCDPTWFERQRRRAA